MREAHIRHGAVGPGRVRSMTRRHRRRAVSKSGVVRAPRIPTAIACRRVSIANLETALPPPRQDLRTPGAASRVSGCPKFRTVSHGPFTWNRSSQPSGQAHCEARPRKQIPDSVTGSWMRCGKDLRRMQLWNPQTYPSAVGRGIPQL